MLIALCGTVAANGQNYCPININLEQGTVSGWQFATAINGGTVGLRTLRSVSPIAGRHSVTSGTALDPYGNFPIVDPIGGTYSLKIGNDNVNAEVDRGTYTFTVPANINNYSLIYRYAVVFENPAHAASEQPWFKVRVYDSATGATINCASFTYVSSGSLPGFTVSKKFGAFGGSIVYYKPWSTASLNLSGQAGKTLVLEFTAADCSLGAHMGYGYVDVSCGLFAISSSTCNATSPLTAPPGFQSYTWYNSNFSTIISTGQSITVPTPSVKTKYHVVLTPFAGYGCTDTLTTEISGSTLAVNAGKDTMICNAPSVTLNPIVTGNAGTVTYNWSPSSSLSCSSCANPAATPTTVTNYIVTVTDTIGCSKKDTVQVKPAPAVTASATPAACFGAANGGLTATAAGGTAPYSYSWNTTPATATATSSSVAAGTYTVTAADANGCRATAQATVSQPAQLIAAISSADSVSCNGGNDGRATAVATGGAAPYSYSWNTVPAKTGATANQLTAARYVVTVIDSLGCSDTQSVVIAQPAQLAMSLQKAQVTCFGGNNGAVTVTPAGGTAPYSFAIGTGAFGSSNTFGNLTAGTYMIHMRDAKSCVLDSTITITQPAALVLSNTATQPLCFGAANGQIQMSANGGTAPYQFAVNAGSFSTSSLATNLAAGSYTIHVRDAAGCQTDSTVVLTQPLPLSIGLGTTAANCHGSNTGAVSGTATGGTSPYQFAIDNGSFGSAAQFNGLAAGTHILHLRDAAGCTKDSTFQITQPAALAMSLTATAPACNGAANGVVQINATGGTAPYQFALNTGSFGSSSSFSALASGSYIVHLRDASGCLLDSAVQLQQPNGLSATFTVTSLACANSTNGAISVNAAGGTAPYSYAINTGSFGSSSTFSNLTAGSQLVHIRDAKGCTIDSAIILVQPSRLQLARTVTQPLCFGAANGQIQMSANGGTAPYQFAVNAGSFSTSSLATNLAAGSYTIHVRDAAGCQTDSTVVLTQPLPLNIGLGTTAANCHGSNTGAVNGTATGGTSPYQFAIDNGSFGSAAQFNGLAAGTHILHLRDAAGCTKDSTFQITQPTALAMSFNATAPACNGAANGSIQVSAAGGTSPYQLALNTGSFGSSTSFSALTAGNHVVHLRDAAGCTLDSTVQLQQPNGLDAAFTVTPISCANGTNGAISVSTTGGSAPYTFALNTGSFGTASTFSGLAAGTYQVHVRDSKGCTIDSAITLVQPARLQLGWTATQPVCYGAASGQISLTATGGAAPYQYAFNAGGYSATAAAGNLTAGSYAVHVRDASGCQSDSVVVLNQPQPLTLSLSKVNVVCYGIAAGAVTGTANGGTAPYQFAINNGSFGTSAQFGALAAGTYTLHLRDAAGCTKDSVFTITQPAALAMSFAVQAPACNGAASGQIQVTPTGGASPYQLALNSGAFGSSAIFSSLQAGTYIVHLRDNLGCTLDSTVQLQQPGSLTASATSTAVSCFGGTNGSAQISATGGTAPYSYAWSNSSAATASVTGLAAGTYTATVTDSKGCVVTVSVTVSQPFAMSATFATTAPTCNGGSNGSATATVTGGTAPYTYSWNAATAQTSATSGGLNSGSHTVIVTDAASCTSTFSLNIAATPAVQMTVTAIDPTCHDGANGKAVAIVTNAAGPHTYSWQGLSGQTGDTARGLRAGSYTVTATTAAGCTATGTTTLNNPDSMRIHVTTRGTCNGSAIGSLSALATGGTAPYHYQWNTVPALPTATISGLPAGAYRVVVTDKLGCKDSAVAAVPAQSGLEVIAATALDTVCKGSKVQLSATGAASYSWSPASLLNCADCAIPVATPTKDTMFTVIGVDSNGCRDTAVVRIAVMQRTPVRVADEVRICEGQTATLSSFGGISRYWLTDKRETESVITVAPTQSTRYGVVITANRCFTDTLYQDVEVLPTPAVEVSGDVEAALGADVTLRASMTNANNITWLPSEGLSCSNCTEPTHRVAGKAIYVAKVTNDLGCAAYDTVRIADVCDERYFFFANMFSPNADGNNDRFYPQGAGNSRVDHFMIYDRWGEVVYSAQHINVNDAAAGWDGTFRNQQLKADVYVYVMDAVCENGKKIVIRGDVTLVR